MIICSCNILDDATVMAALTAERPPQTIRQVYVELGCEARCGRCASTIRSLRDHLRQLADKTQIIGSSLRAAA